MRCPMLAPARDWGFAVVAAGLFAAGCAGEDAPQPAAAAPSAEGAATGEGLPLSRQEIVATFADHGLPAGAFEELSLDDGREVFVASFPESASRQALWVGIFGDAEVPHTVRMDVFPRQTTPEEALTIADTVDDLVATMFPGWPEGSKWPAAAGIQAWEETAKLRGREGGSRQIPVETERNGVWLGALGVPHQVLSYVFTVRQACRPSEASSGFYEGYVGCG
jgi:hypothetical protein